MADKQTKAERALKNLSITWGVGTGGVSFFVSFQGFGIKYSRENLGS